MIVIIIIISIITIILFYFISFAKKKTNKQTSKQTERTLTGTPQQLWPITAGPDTNKKNNSKKINTAIHSNTIVTT